MRRNVVAVVGAAETTKLGVIPDLSQIGLHADAALNTLKDAGLKAKDIDGVACAGQCGCGGLTDSGAGTGYDSDCHVLSFEGMLGPGS